MNLRNQQVQIHSHVLNTLGKLEAGAHALRNESISILLRLLSPIAPHIGQKLWQELGFGDDILTASWPEVDEQALVKDSIELVVQVNGKVRGHVTVAAGTDDKVIEELALADPYFVDRNLYPNMDFYSGMLLRSIGIPTNMFTVCFAIGRLPGWIAQWKESVDDPKWRLSRPRQIYTGQEKREYIAITKRG